MQPKAPDFVDYLIGGLLFVGFIASLSWVLWRSLKRSDDPMQLVVKWMLTILGVAFLLKVCVPMVAQGGLTGAFGGIPATAATGLYLAIVWRQSIGALIAKPFASLYDGGDTEPEPKPHYSPALAKRKRGDFLGAKADVRAQLLKFPNDFEGQMLLAEIEAQDLQDLQAAGVVVERVVTQMHLAPPNIAYALNSLADWHLKYTQDIDAARACVERIIERLPDSEWEQRARQRLGHLTPREMMDEANERRRIKVTHVEGDPGLEMGRVSYAPVEPAAGELATEYVRHLAEHPHDTEVREKLAQLYAEHYQRPDLAQDQLEQLIQYPNQPPKQVVRWLNLLADLQVKHGAAYDAVRGTLQRIIDLYPNAASANLAQNRIELLRLEFKGKEKSQAVTLGSYEDDLGLKRGLPHQF